MTDQERPTAGATGSLELGTGFVDDDVTVLLDGHEVWHGSGVTTNYSVGLAAVVPLPAAAGTEPVLEVRVGSRAQGSARVHTGAALEGMRMRADLDPAGSMGIGPAPEGPVY